MQLLLGILLFLGVLDNCQSASRMTTAEIATTMDKHNTLRRIPGAADMEILVWNEALGTLAQDWVDACSYDYDSAQTVGKNRYYSTVTMDYAAAIQTWDDQSSNYDYGSNTCAAGQTCTDYTQVVWAASTEIGCASKKCPTLQDSGGMNEKQANYFLCYYTTQGNTAGVKPYVNGTACTQCASGSGWCENGLCNMATCTDLTCTCIWDCQNCGVIQDNCTCNCLTGWAGNECTDGEINSTTPVSCTDTTTAITTTMALTTTEVTTTVTTPSVTTTTGTTETTPTVTTTTGTTETTPTVESTSSAVTSFDTKQKCPKHQDAKSPSVYLSVPGDRTKFYQCVHGRTVQMPCAPSTCMPKVYKGGNPCTVTFVRGRCP